MPVSTKGSAPNTNAFVVIVSVAVIDIFKLFVPASPNIPEPSLASGLDEYCKGFEGKISSKSPVDDLYFLG